MKFSIVIPVYNVEKYLRTCIQSILIQEYCYWEMILVDDGSTDNSGRICDDYMVKYPDKINVIHKKNDGLYQARLTGYDYVTGDYICNLDSDDYVENNYLKYLYNFITNNKQIDIINFGYNKVVNNKNISSTLLTDRVIFYNKSNGNRIFKELFVFSQTNNTVWNKVYSVKLIKKLKKNKYYNDYRISLGEDLLFNSFFMMEAESIVFLPICLYNYRIQPNSITNNNINLEKINDMLFTYNYYGLIIKNNIEYTEQDLSIYYYIKYIDFLNIIKYEKRSKIFKALEVFDKYNENIVVYRKADLWYKFFFILKRKSNRLSSYYLKAISFLSIITRKLRIIN